MAKPILCLDFDGVLHSYSSGWKSARNIPDPPVPGALEFVVKSLDHFTVAIYSSRSHQWGGRRAMKRWLYDLLVFEGIEAELPPKWWMNYISHISALDPWDVSVRDAARLVVKTIQWPNHKPSAMITIDDRAIQFTGEWPKVADLKAFRPWNKK